MSPQRKAAYVVMVLSIAIPLAAMFWKLEVGIVLLLIGLFITVRAFRFLSPRDPEKVSDSTLRQIDEHQNNRGGIVYVQLVDDFGRDLPAEIAQRRMEEAQARANPRDMVVGIRQVLNKNRSQ